MNAVSLAEFLMNEGADVDARLKADEQPLTNELKGVLEAATGAGGWDLWLRQGETPLHIAAQKSALDVVRYLVGKGADVNAKSNNGQTPLYNAARKNDLDVAKYLVELGADVHAKDNDGGTLLHMAAWNNAPDVAKYLVGLMSMQKTMMAIRHWDLRSIFTPPMWPSGYGRKARVSI